VTERARLKELERQNRELRMENEFLGKAALLTWMWVTGGVVWPVAAGGVGGGMRTGAP
jgi:hypothetical protein